MCVGERERERERELLAQQSTDAARQLQLPRSAFAAFDGTSPQLCRCTRNALSIHRAASKGTAGGHPQPCPQSPLSQQNTRRRRAAPLTLQHSLLCPGVILVTHILIVLARGRVKHLLDGPASQRQAAHSCKRAQRHGRQRRPCAGIGLWRHHRLCQVSHRLGAAVHLKSGGCGLGTAVRVCCMGCTPPGAGVACPAPDQHALPRASGLVCGERPDPQAPSAHVARQVGG